MGRTLPAVEVNNYTSIFTSPIFKNQDGEWYRDVGYNDSLDIIRENFQGAAKSFIAIGYYLKHIKQNQLYKEGGYPNIWECAKDEFGLSQSAASRYMTMNDVYSANGDTPMLDDKYVSFNKSQLQEMLALPDDQREAIKPNQTVQEIRKLSKAKERQSEEIEEVAENKIPGQIEISDYPEYMPENQMVIEGEFKEVERVTENVVDMPSKFSDNKEENKHVNQLDLPELSNNEKRGAFIDNYKLWPIWIETEQTGERYYRYELPDGKSFVVKVYYHKCFDYNIQSEKCEDKYHDDWGSEEYYLIKDDKHFKDCLTNRSSLIDFLKELQKNSKQN